mgnify:CR=1 FL=1
MLTQKQRGQRRRDVLRVFEQERWGSMELLDGWDGEELDELKTILDEEEFQTLLDRLRDQDERR